MQAKEAWKTSFEGREKATRPRQQELGLIHEKRVMGIFQAKQQHA